MISEFNIININIHSANLKVISYNIILSYTIRNTLRMGTTASLLTFGAFAGVGILYCICRKCFSESGNDRTDKKMTIIVCGPKRSGKSSFINLMYAASKRYAPSDIHTIDEVAIPSKYIANSANIGKEIGKMRYWNPQAYSYLIQYVNPLTNESINLEFIEAPGIDLDKDPEVDKSITIELIKKFKPCKVLLVMNGSKCRKDCEYENMNLKLSEIASFVESPSLFLLLTNSRLSPNLERDDFPSGISIKNIYFYDNVLFSVDMQNTSTNKKMRANVSDSYEECLTTAKNLIDRMIEDNTSTILTGINPI